MIAVNDLLRGDTLLAGTLGHRHAMLITAAHEQHVLTLQAQVAHVDVGRHIYASQVANVDGTVSIRQRRRHQRPRKFLLILHRILSIFLCLLSF